MTEIDLDNDQRNVERGGTAATDIQLEAQQRATQALHVHQVAVHAAADADTKGMALPSLQLYSDPSREWPMARLCISNKQVNRLVRTFLWRRVAESALHGTYFGNIPEEINPDYIADLHRISEAFAAPLAHLFAFAKQGHQLCSFIPQKQLALYANPLFWQYGLFAFVSRCCSHNNQHRRQNTSAAKAAQTKHEESGEKDVDALTFMQTVIMSFVRGMEYGDQTLPINDLFVYFPVQLVPALVTAMKQQRFTPVEVKGGCGYRPRKQEAEDLLFFARVGALCVPRGTSHRDEFVWGVRGMSLTKTTSRTKPNPKTKNHPNKPTADKHRTKGSGSSPYESKRAKGADPRTNTEVKRGDEFFSSRSQYRTSRAKLHSDAICF